MFKSEFYQKWLNAFAKDIPKEKMEKHVVSPGNYIWHVFSWELVPKAKYLIGDSARKAFDKISKDNAIYLNWYDDEILSPLPPQLFTAKEIDIQSEQNRLYETYVVAEDFSWTYIKTHESSCGPYFMQK